MVVIMLLRLERGVSINNICLSINDLQKSVDEDGLLYWFRSYFSDCMDIVLCKLQLAVNEKAMSVKRMPLLCI